MESEEEALRDLSARIEQVSDRLEVVAFRKPATRKQWGIFSPTYAVEVRDKLTGLRFIVSTEELIERGLIEAARIQRAALLSNRLRVVAILLVAVIALGLPTALRAPVLGALLAAVGLLVTWLWRRATRLHPKEMPGFLQQLSMSVKPPSVDPPPGRDSGG